VPAVRECGYEDVAFSDGSDVRSTAEKDSFDLIILNTPLADEFGLNLAQALSSKSDAGFIIACSGKNCDEVTRKTSSMGVYVLAKPFTKSVLMQAVRFVSVSRDRLRAVTAEKEKLEKKLYNLKQIDRAKCVLIEYLRISEADAHRQIQKRAMDQRVPEIEIAMDILRTYEM
jgi:response regulator NasT